jgi:hypothetical protein
MYVNAVTVKNITNKTYPASICECCYCVGVCRGYVQTCNQVRPWRFPVCLTMQPTSTRCQNQKAVSALRTNHRKSLNAVIEHIARRFLWRYVTVLRTGNFTDGCIIHENYKFKIKKKTNFILCFIPATLSQYKTSTNILIISIRKQGAFSTTSAVKERVEVFSFIRKVLLMCHFC